MNKFLRLILCATLLLPLGCQSALSQSIATRLKGNVIVRLLACEMLYKQVGTNPDGSPLLAVKWHCPQGFE